MVSVVSGVSTAVKDGVAPTPVETIAGSLLVMSGVRLIEVAEAEVTEVAEAEATEVAEDEATVVAETEATVVAEVLVAEDEVVEGDRGVDAA